MKIHRLEMSNFMAFDELDIQWSPNINIISGENSTGKTTLLKILYSSLKPISKSNIDIITKDKLEELFVEKLLGVFRPDEGKVGRMVGRLRGCNHCNYKVYLENDAAIAVSFGNRQEKHIDIDIKLRERPKKFEPVYIPPKEMISTTEHFLSLYEDYHLDFEETYYDLTKLLDKPLKRGTNTTEQKNVLSSFENIMDGNIIQKDKKFYLKVEGAGEFEMGLVSEGYRKLATIIYLISSGSLDKNSILFWDEPETNMNPRMIRPIAEAIIQLAKMGVQIFISTHDYFVQQCFNLLASYPKSNKYEVDIQFISLFFDKGRKIRYECANTISELSQNAIMEEFDALYDREQEILYED